MKELSQCKLLSAIANIEQIYYIQYWLFICLFKPLMLEETTAQEAMLGVWLTRLN